MLIRLTFNVTNEPVWLNAAHVERFERDKEGQFTWVKTVGTEGPIQVTELPITIACKMHPWRDLLGRLPYK